MRVRVLILVKFYEGKLVTEENPPLYRTHTHEVKHNYNMQPQHVMM